MHGEKHGDIFACYGEVDGVGHDEVVQLVGGLAEVVGQFED